MQKKKERYRPRHLAERMPLLPEGDMGIISLSIASILLAVLLLVPFMVPAGREGPDGPIGTAIRTPAGAMPATPRPVAAQLSKPATKAMGQAKAAAAGMAAELERIHAEMEAEAARLEAERAAEQARARARACIDANPYYSEAVPLTAELQLALYESCQERDIPYQIGLGLIDVESDFDEDALNPDSLCYGLCQINPEYWPAGLGPADNIRQGMEILRIYLDGHGQDMAVALTCYHAGHDNDDRTYSDAVFSDAAKWAAEVGL